MDDQPTGQEPVAIEATAPQESAEAAPAAETQQAFDADYVARLRAENAKYRNIAKENADKAARLDEIEEASKSEAEKLRARLEAAERKATEAEQNRLRMEIAAAKGVPADLLAGSTEEEMTESADRLLAFRGSNTPQADPAVDYGRTANSDPSKSKQQLTKTDLDRMSPEEIVAADEAGLFDDLKAGRAR